MTHPNYSDTYAFSTAKLQNGQTYVGNQMFQGSGMSRSCIRCGHRSYSGFKMLKPWGMVCQKCHEHVSNRRAMRAAAQASS